MDPILINKTFVAKAEATSTPGEFVAIVSAFGNKDSQGDVVEKGAFEKTLAEWIVKGRPIPVVWSHQFHDPESIIGEYTAAEETSEGLKMTGVLDVEENPRAARIHKNMLKGRIAEFSISGQVRDYEFIEDDEDDWWPSIRIKDIDLWEAGPCFKGANSDTELLSVKSDGRLTGSVRTAIRKEGRVLAQKHVDALKTAHTQLGEIIAAVDTTKPDNDDGEESKSKSKAAENQEEPPARSGPSTTVRALLELPQE